MRVDLTKAVLAGVAGTVLFDLTGLALTGAWWDIPGLLAAKLGLGLSAGVAAHYANGVILATIFAALADSIPGPRIGRPFLFITVQTVVGVWLFMLPLLDMGFAGLGANSMLPIITLARHYAYAVPLILLAGHATANSGIADTTPSRA